MDINWFDADYLPWLILFFPLLSFGIIVLFTAHSRILSQVVAMTGVCVAWLLSMIEFIKVVWASDAELGKEVFGSTVDWMTLGVSTFKMGVLVDPLTAYMLLMVPLACLAIFVYSLGYMRGDPHNSRFFGYISLFAGAMLTLVLADNLLMLFIGWEVMGLCSYLLIGFWSHKKSAYQAGVKAFMTTRVGDVLMLAGVGYLFLETRTLSFRDILYDEAVLEKLVNTPSVLFGGSAAALIGVLLVMGTIGKSSQFPLHAWLPDAMEGPTPVSAMIHAATMVSAGVYMVVRMFPLLSAGADFHNGDFSTPMIIMGLVGGFTALFAAVLAVGQNDIKRILAYSTISQLGYMVAALGVGAWVAAAFHLVNHAFFKALLFMCSGVVIHSMEHGEQHAAEHGHDPAPHAEPDGLVMDYVAPPNDVLRMGGLFRKLPITAITMAIGGLSLAGFPLITAGFWSKDEIISEAWHGTTEGYPLALFVLLVLATAALLTAFYTARMWFLTFWGKPRTAAAEHAGEGSQVSWRNLWARLRRRPAKATDPGEQLTALQMEIPLLVLAFLAIFAGFIGVHTDFPLLGDLDNPLHEFLSGTLIEHPPVIDFDWLPVLVSVALALGGLAVGFVLYGIRPLAKAQVDPTERALGPGIWQALQNRFYIDMLIRRYVLRPAEHVARKIVIEDIDKDTIDGVLESVAEGFIWLGEAFKRFNTVVIDGVGDGIPRAIGDFGSWFRQVQTGRIQQYLLVVTLALLIIGALFLIQVG
ncbi:MAG: NADH-quinone oxidoreductase subunit L [Anaerolineae bacterium]|nr:NADH-quinone oxidoreductase subunit L [Anaerolineae bacterium]